MTVSVDMHSLHLVLTHYTPDGYKSQVELPYNRAGQALEQVWDRHKNLIHATTYPRHRLGSTNLDVYTVALANTHRRINRKVS